MDAAAATCVYEQTSKQLANHKDFGFATRKNLRLAFSRGFVSRINQTRKVENAFVAETVVVIENAFVAEILCCNPDSRKY